MARRRSKNLIIKSNQEIMAISSKPTNGSALPVRLRKLMRQCMATASARPAESIAALLAIGVGIVLLFS